MPQFSDSRATRKVDFCVYIQPPPAEGDLIHDIQRSDLTLGSSINHTAYGPLRQNPVAFAIETKPSGEGLSSAVTQLLVWMEGHWNLLHYMAGRRGKKPGMPEFLPGIIVQGHDWWLVASTEKWNEERNQHQLVSGKSCSSSKFRILTLPCLLDSMDNAKHGLYSKCLGYILARCFIAMPCALG